MITEEHFAILRKLRAEAEQLRLVCIEANEPASLLHIAYDRQIPLKTPKGVDALVCKLQAMQ